MSLKVIIYWSGNELVESRYNLLIFGHVFDAVFIGKVDRAEDRTLLCAINIAANQRTPAFLKISDKLISIYSVPNSLLVTIFNIRWWLGQIHRDVGNDFLVHFHRHLHTRIFAVIFVLVVTIWEAATEDCRLEKVLIILRLRIDVTAYFAVDE